MNVDIRYDTVKEWLTLTAQDDIFRSYTVDNAYICDGDELIVILKPRHSTEDSFADKIVEEIEEYEQLALDI